MNSILLSPLEFLLTTLFSLYIGVVMLRFLLQAVRADFYNPLSQFIVKVTNPLLLPLRRFIPGLWGFDMAALLLMVVLQICVAYLIVIIGGKGIGPWGVLIWSLSELVGLAFNVFIFSILIQALMSWLNPDPFNPAFSLLHSLNEPILAPIRRFVPPMSGIDLSALVALIGLQTLKLLVVPLILYLGF